MGFYAFYVIAAVILILHFTGWLKRHNVEWLIKPAVIPAAAAVRLRGGRILPTIDQNQTLMLSGHC